jgi:hypothetical protein
MSEFQNHLSSVDVPEELSGPEGLLFTGEAIRSLTPEKIAAIGDFANRMFGVKMRPLRHLQAELTDSDVTEEQETDPVPVTRKDLLDFADRHGYPKQRARLAWNSRVYGGEESSEPQRFKGDNLPPIRLLRTVYDPELEQTVTFPRDQVVDLKSVYALLKQCQIDHPSIEPPLERSHITVPFLAHMCNEVLQPDEPLVFDTER